MATFNERFKMLRKEKNLTQQKIADMFFLNKSSISKYEKGVHMPENELLQKFSDYFGVSVDYLLGRTDIRPGELFNGSGHLKNTFTIENMTIGGKPYNSDLTPKDEKDVEKLLNKTMDYIEEQEGLMLNGEILDENDLLLLKQAIKNGLEIAKISNKKRFTPKKYRK